MAGALRAHYADLVQIGPYTVLEEIARGGMGVVYRAQDAEGRLVALKLLLAKRSQEQHARKRFEKEVSALSRLRHPQIVPILGTGEHEGSPWLALEYVEGESLQARLARGPLPIDEAVRVARQLAQALGYMHRCGVLHRDLKPDNVLLRGDEALLTDFGLVLDQQSSRSRLTATGIFQGSPGYWAPEQARGQVQAHGPTTDVYGLGAVLYACLTARAPVEAASLQEHLQTVRFRRTQAPRELRPDVPAWLSELCMRCLAPEPQSRPASADEVARGLVLAGGAVDMTASGRSLGAWPWVVAALGLALTTALLGWAILGGGNPEPQPREPTPPPPVDDAEVEPPAAGEPPPAAPEPSEGGRDPEAARAAFQLGVEHATQGRFAEAVEAFGRAVQLDPGYVLAHAGRGRAKAEQQLWAEALADFDRAIELRPDDARLYANRAQCQAGLRRFAEAIADNDRAIQLDPDFAVAYRGRAECELQLGRPAEALPDFDRAVQLDPNDALTYRSRASARTRLGRYAMALADLDRALELDPSDALAFSNRGGCKATLQRFEEAIADFDRALQLAPERAVDYALRGDCNSALGELTRAIEDYDRALELDPNSVLAYRGRATCRTRQGRFEEAIVDLDRALALDPNNGSAIRNRGQCKLQLGRLPEAIEDFDRALGLDPDDPLAHRSRGYCKARLGRYAEALADYDRAIELRPDDANALRNRGFSRAQLGRYAEAIEDYDRALELDPSSAAQVRQLREQAARQLAGE